MNYHISRTVRTGIIAVGFVISAAYATTAESQGTARRSAGAASISPGDEAAIRAELDSTAAGWNRGDLDTYLSDYTDDIVSRSGNGFVTGKEPARTVMLQGYWKTGRPIQTLHYEHLDVRGLGADYAVMTGEYVLTGAGRPDRTGWFTTIWRRTPAGWRCMHDHSS